MKQANVHIGARIPASLADGLARRAVEEDRSVSAELRRALWRHVRDLNDDEPPRSGSIANTTPANQEPVGAED